MEFYSQLADLVLNIEFASFLCSSSLSSSPFFFRKWFDQNSPYSLSYILRKGSRKGASSSSFNHSNSVLRMPPLRGSLPFGILSRILKRKLLLCNSSRNLNQNREWSRSLLFFLDSHRYFRCTGRFLNWCTRSFRCRKKFLFTRRSGCLIHHIFFFPFCFFHKAPVRYLLSQHLTRQNSWSIFVLEIVVIWFSYWQWSTFWFPRTTTDSLAFVNNCVKEPRDMVSLLSKSFVESLPAARTFLTYQMLSSLLH